VREIMAKQITFAVSKPSAGLKTECTWDAPESVNDPRWAEVVSNAEEDINELAVQNLVIKMQSGARNELEENGAEAAQRYVNEYKYRAGGGGGFKRVAVGAQQVKELRFTEAQIAALRAAGVKFETEEAAEPVEA
jgi:hypothetical protein